EPGDEARHLTRQSLDRVLERRPLVGRRRHPGPGEDEAARVLLGIERLPIQDLELDQRMWIGGASPVGLMIRQISTEPARGVSVTGSDHGALISAMIGFSNGGAESSSLSTRSRVATEVRGSSSGTDTSARGIELLSRWLSRWFTLNSITLVGTTSSPSGNGAFASLLSTNDLPSAPLKSMMTSKRSATPIVRSSSRTGAGRKPPSAPIWMKLGPERPVSEPSARASFRVRW